MAQGDGGHASAKKKTPAKTPKRSEAIANAVAELHKPRIRDYEPEEVDEAARVVAGSESLYDDDDESDGRVSKLRRQAASAEDIPNAHKGKVVRRDQLDADDDDFDDDDMDIDDNDVDEDVKEGDEDMEMDMDNDEEEDDEDENEDEEQSAEERDDDDDDFESNGVDDENEDEEEDEAADKDNDDEDAAEDMEHTLKQLQEEEASVLQLHAEQQAEQAKRSEHARHQRQLWEFGMDLRIRLQKTLTLTNRLPPHESLQKLEKTDKTFRGALQSVRPELGGLLSDLLDLQRNALAETYVSVSGKKRTREERDLSIDALWEEIADFHTQTESFRHDIIEKWNRKTRLSSSLHDTAKGQLKAINQSVLSQISAVLADQSRLVRRAQLKRTSGRVLCKPPQQVNADSEEKIADTINRVDSTELSESLDEEIFDDTDFYQSLLREVTALGLDAATSDELLAAAQRARKKVKKNVDRRASKGRKIRYVVQPKLVNFMAPIVREGDVSLSDELLTSLFGNRTIKAAS